MSEEMKMILALIRHLNLEIKATGGDVTSELVDEDLYSSRGSEYTYVVSVKS